MSTLAGLQENFRFLVLEVTKQVERTQLLLKHPDAALRAQIERRDDYIDHLKARIENGCFNYLRHHGDIPKTTADWIRSLSVITANLERVADHAVNVVGQTGHFDDPTYIQRYPYEPFFKRIITALRLVVDAFEDGDGTKAIRICETEAELDALYKHKFERILTELTAGGEHPNLVTSLFIFHYLERMGDCLLNIGEAILLPKVGERVKFNQVLTLRDSLSAARESERTLDELSLEGIWGTRSGCRIGKVSEGDNGGPDDHEVIYKEGNREKIRQEKEKIELWRQLVPDLPPRVVKYRESDNGDDAALLIEYLEGSNLQEIVLSQEASFVAEALEATLGTMRSVWLMTRKDTPASAGFLAQLRARLDDVLKVHPDFQLQRKQIGALEIPDAAQLLERNLDLDAELAAPFTVFGHGDFNLDNVIYNPAREQVHYIDLHRSGDQDYLQDVAVLLVSTFRLPVFQSELRDRLNRVAATFYRFTREFAAEQGDATFGARLTLGLVRSLITSTRFELDRSFAREMAGRAVFLLERLDAHRGQDWAAFTLPEMVLYY